MRQLISTPDKHGQKVGEAWKLDGPVIQAMMGNQFAPFVTDVVFPSDVGFAFFETNVLSPDVIHRIRAEYRRVAVASTDGAWVLCDHGFSDVTIVPHGVDAVLFCPALGAAHDIRGFFVVFSGGKFELRKGQDIVIRAYKVLQDRHKDVMLVYSWQNSGPKSRGTDGRVPAYPLSGPGRQRGLCRVDLSNAAAHGVDISRVVGLGLRDQRLLPDVYHSTDLGLFPNCAEGGNNQVLMEYLACGKPRRSALTPAIPTLCAAITPSLLKDIAPCRGVIPMNQRGPGTIRAWKRPSTSWNGVIRTATSGAFGKTGRGGYAGTVLGPDG